MTSMMTRRSLMLSGASMAVAIGSGLRQGAHAQAPVTVEQFRSLSARLTGAALPDLDAGVARTLLDGFIANGRGPGLALLAGDPNVTTGTVADDIVAAWYSGVYDTPQGEALATFNDALVWNALDFTKPFGTCGGETGYWSEPPQD